MTLNAIYNSQDEIPEAYRELFSERGGKWELTGVTGIKTQADIDRLQTSLTKERTDHKATKDRLRKVHFGGLSVVEMNDDQLSDFATKMDGYEELVASAGKVDDEKINSIVESRIKTRLAPVERDRDALKNQLAESQQRIVGFETESRRRLIHDALRAAAQSANVLPSAVDDLLLLGERVFDVGDNGAVTVKDQVGFTPGISPDVFLSEIQEKRPHWWPESNGGGAKGGKVGKGGASNPWSKEHWNLTRQGEIIRSEGIEKANQYAKAAGVEVGATAPAA